MCRNVFNRCERCDEGHGPDVLLVGNVYARLCLACQNEFVRFAREGGVLADWLGLKARRDYYQSPAAAVAPERITEVDFLDLELAENAETLKVHGAVTAWLATKPAARANADAAGEAPGA